MTKKDIIEDDPQDIKDNPGKYVDLTKIAEDCNGSYEKFAIKCDLVGVKIPDKKEFEGYAVNGGYCARHIRPLDSYVESFKKNNNN